MTDFAIRAAENRDETALVAIIRAAYAPFADAIPDLPDVAGGIGDDIRDHTVLVAHSTDDLLGVAVLIVGDNMAKLANLAVHPDQGGRGIGRALISAVEDQARDSGADRLDLATHAAMPGNIRLYTRLGWIETGREGNRVFMSKTLR